MYCCLVGVCVSCGNNNNQSEGSADKDDVNNATATPAQSTTTGNDAGSTPADTVIKGHNSGDAQGNHISGTGENNGSGKTGGG